MKVKEVNSIALIKTGYKQTKLGLVPDEWRIQTIANIAEISGGYAFKSNLMLDEKSDFQILKMANIYLGKLDLSRSPSYWKEPLDREKDFLLKKNDIVLTLTGTVGKRDFGYATVIEQHENLLLNQRLCKIVARENTNQKYLFYALKSERFLYYFFLSGRGGTGNQANVGTNDIKDIQIPLPPLPEQQKIAKILSTWDKAISKTEQLIAKKQECKKGLMQQLLTGKKRFKEFVKSDKSKETKLGWIPEDWEVRALEEIGSFLKGKGVAKAEITDNGLPSLTYGELYTRHHDIIRIFTSFINEQSANNSKELAYGDILFAGSGETLNEIGKSAAFVDDFKAYAGGDIIIYRDHDQCPEYLGYLFNHDTVNRQKYRLGQGHSVVHIYSSSLKHVLIPVPSIEEQQTIASVISSADKEITSLHKQLEKLKDQKKGLMQKLLTGEVRVKID